MTAYTKQSKRPKPAKPQDIIDRFKRDMSEAGFDVYPIYNLGTPYTPVISIEVWRPKKAEKETEQ